VLVVKLDVYLVMIPRFFFKKAEICASGPFSQSEVLIVRKLERKRQRERKLRQGR
jgi:hypothetical protein